MYIFMRNFKFESGGPAAMDSGLAAMSILFFIIYFFFGLIFYNLLTIISLIFLFIWIYGYIKFFIYVYKK